MTNKEVRYFDVAEFRALQDENGEKVLEGYAAVFNSRSELLGNFYEEIEYGAFAEVLGNDAVALLNHDSNYPLARVSNGSLVLEQDEVGLKTRFKLPDTSYARDIWNLVGEGILKQMSFAFAVGKDSWSKLEDGTPLRKIRSVSRLYDVSVVTYPAYPETSVQARSMALELAEASEDKNDVMLKHQERERQLKLFGY